MNNVRAQRRTALGFIAAVVFACLGYLWFEQQSRPVNDSGFISLSGIEFDHDDDVLQLKANAKIRLPPEVEAGLDSGVPLTFVLEFGVKQPRRWLPALSVLAVQRRFKLTYYELTRHYRLDELDADASRNYRSLTSALTGLGELATISVALNAQQQEHFALPGLKGTVSMRLSKSALPLPLQPILRSNWILVSEEYQWPVT